MPLRLRDNLHWCNCGGRAIFLDLAADRYFCLPAGLNDAFLRLATGNPERNDARRLSFLAPRGLPIDKAGEPRDFNAAGLEPPSADYPTDASRRVRPVEVARAFVSEVRTAWQLRTRAILSVVTSVTRPSPKHSPISKDIEQSLQTIVQAAAACAIVNRSHNRCLVRAFAVHGRCRRRGIQSKLVFGVIARPFEAHCWVQHGSLVLVGDFEQARLFTPILVIE